MKVLFITIAMVFVGLTLFGQQNTAVGHWLSASGEGQIEIYNRADKLYGKISWLKQPKDEQGKPKTDLNNPDSKLRHKPLLGLEILKNFSIDGNGEWTGGTIYDPKSGKTYSCKLSLKKNDQLHIRGYVGISLLGKTEIWKRVK